MNHYYSVLIFERNVVILLLLPNYLLLTSVKHNVLFEKKDHYFLTSYKRKRRINIVRCTETVHINHQLRYFY